MKGRRKKVKGRWEKVKKMRVAYTLGDLEAPWNGFGLALAFRCWDGLDGVV